MPYTANVEKALVLLYRDVLGDVEIDFRQLVAPADIPAMSTAETGTAINDMRDDLILSDSRLDRYIAALAFTLAVRRTRVLPALTNIDSQIKDLETDLLAAVGASPAGGDDLRAAVEKLLDLPEMREEVVDLLLSAFGPALEIVESPTGTFQFLGSATEMAAMLCELASVSMACDSSNGFVTEAGTRYKVLRLRYEVCTQLPFEILKRFVDPRRWPDGNPIMFKKIQVIQGFAPTLGSWHGTIQETVGLPYTGLTLITNLLVSYLEAPGMAVTTYDLSHDQGLSPNDDGFVKVDYGYFGVVDEGSHCRVEILKVVAISGLEALDPHWLCPLWAQQLGMIGWGVEW